MNSRAFYNKQAEFYNYRHESPSTLFIRGKEKMLLQRFVKGRVLDIGCGTGYHLDLLKNVVGIDVSEGMLRIARERIKPRTLDNRSKSDAILPLVQAKAEELPFRNGSFDAVIFFFNVLGRSGIRKSISEIKRVLKRDGLLIISFSSIWDRGLSFLKKLGKPPKEKYKHFRIKKLKTKLYLFSKQEVLEIFKDKSFNLVCFDSAFIFYKPQWGNRNPFSFWERVKLALDFLFKEKGCIYFFVFRKTSKTT